MNFLDFLDYQLGTSKSAIYPGAGDPLSYAGLSYVGLGLAGEAGEVAGKVKKVARDDNCFIGDTARAKIADELGDVLWYVSQMATQLGLRLEDVARANLTKLEDRANRSSYREMIQAGCGVGSGDNR